MMFKMQGGRGKSYTYMHSLKTFGTFKKSNLFVSKIFNH